MRFFVMEYNRKTDEGRWTEFAEVDAALADLSVKEAERFPEMEVVLLMGRSIEDLKITHGRYFMTPTEMVQRLKDGLAEDQKRVLQAS